MNLLDLLLLAILGGSIVAGFVAGFARTAIGFIAVIGGTICGFWFYTVPAAWIRPWVSSPTLANILGFVVVFFAFQLVGGIVGKLLSKMFKWTGLSWLDRLMGAGFGIVRGALVAVAFVSVLMAFTSNPPPNWMVDSLFLPYAVDASHLCASLAPQGLKEAFNDTLTEMRRAWDEQVKNAEKLRRERKSKSDLKKVEN